MNKILVLSLLSVSIFTVDLRASLLPAPKTDMEKIEELRTLMRNERFAKGCLDLEATILVSTIEDSETRTSATLLMQSAQIKALRADVRKMQKKCCVIL